MCRITHVGNKHFVGFVKVHIAATDGQYTVIKLNNIFVNNNPITQQFELHNIQRLFITIIQCVYTHCLHTATTQLLVNAIQKTSIHYIRVNIEIQTAFRPIISQMHKKYKYRVVSNISRAQLKFR